LSAPIVGALLFWEQRMTDIPETGAQVRQMYVDGKSVAAIKAETELSSHAIYFWLDGGPTIDGKRLAPPIPRRVARVHKVTSGARRALVARIMRSAELQVSAIERRLESNPEQMDKDARTLAVISRTLSELTAIDERNRETKRRKAPTKNEAADPVVDDHAPDDVDELRRSLARQLDAIIAQGGGMLSGQS
jgi:hypothetical protein